MIRATRAGYDQLSGCGLNLLTRDELDQIHYGTLEVLEQAGLKVFSEEALEIYYSHGCNVDKKNNIVKIPSYIVEEAIKSAPSKVVLAGRDPKHDVILEGHVDHIPVTWQNLLFHHAAVPVDGPMVDDLLHLVGGCRVIIHRGRLFFLAKTRRRRRFRLRATRS